MEKEHIISRIASLKTMPVNDLKKMWEELYESKPPAFNRGFLEARIAYRLQEIAFGGLDDSTTKKLNNLVGRGRSRLSKPEAIRPQVGTVLVREFKGVEYRVKVLQDGFEYQGFKYTSLTAVASKITGCSYSGVRFFGLKGQMVKL
jgi:hypothetical protein